VKRPRSDRGSAGAELVILTSLAIWPMFVFGVVTAGWIQARQVVVDAAQVAAEAAAVAQPGSNPYPVALTYATAEVAKHGLSCGALGPFVTLVVVPNASVRVTVTCTAPASRVLLPGWPGHVTITESSTAVVTPLRSGGSS